MTLQPYNGETPETVNRPDPVFEQILLVRTDETDSDDEGHHHWYVHYVLYHVEDEDGLHYDLYEGDDKGNGKMVCKGTNKTAMVHMTLRLGSFIEWKTGEKVG